MATFNKVKALINEKKIIKVGLLSAIILLALILRLQPSAQEKTRGGFGPFGDTFLYHNIAYNLYMGNGFSGTPDERTFGVSASNTPLKYEPTATRGPIYPVFMCIVYKLFGKNNLINNWSDLWNKVRIVQGVLDALLCLVIYFFVRIIIPSSSIPAIISSILYCFSFYNIYYSRALLTESLTTFLIGCFVLFLAMGLKGHNTNKWIINAGIIMGVVTLTRPEYILFIYIFTLFIYYYFNKHGARELKKALLFITAAFIIILPWTVRNYLVFKSPIIVSVSGLGYNLFLGTFEDKSSQKKWGQIPKSEFNERQKIIIKKLTKRYKDYFYNGDIKIKAVDAVFMEIALNRIKNDPLGVLKIWLKRIPGLWFHKYTPYKKLEPAGLYFSLYFILSVFAFYFSEKEEKKMIAPIIVLFLYITAIFLPLHIEPRYGAPLMPGIISITGIGIWKMYEKGKKNIIRLEQRFKSFEKR